MSLFKGKAFFSPSVPRSVITAWVTHGGTVVLDSIQDFRSADYVFCNGKHDACLARFTAHSMVVIHASWVWTSVQERFLMPIARFVLDDFFKPLDDAYSQVVGTSATCYDNARTHSDAYTHTSSQADHNTVSNARAISSNPNDNASIQAQVKPSDRTETQLAPDSIPIKKGAERNQQQIELKESAGIFSAKRVVGSNADCVGRPYKRTRFADNLSNIISSGSHRAFHSITRDHGGGHVPFTESGSRQSFSDLSMSTSTSGASLTSFSCSADTSVSSSGSGIDLTSTTAPVDISGSKLIKVKNSDNFAKGFPSLIPQYADSNSKGRSAAVSRPTADELNIGKATDTTEAVKNRARVSACIRGGKKVGVDPRTAFLNAVYAQAHITNTAVTDNADAQVPLRVNVKAFLEAARGATPSGAVLFVVNEKYEGRLFRCEKR